MATPFPLLLLLLLLPSPAPAGAASLSPLPATSNASAHAYAFAGREQVPAPDPTFFDDVIDAVADKHGWDPDAEVRVWPLDAEGALVGAVQRYEFRARAGGALSALARSSDEAVDWSRPDAPAVKEVVGPDGVDFVAGDGAIGFGSGVRDLDLFGPFELVVSDGAGGGLAELQLPSLNATYTGLKRVLVAAGVALKITGSSVTIVAHETNVSGGHMKPLLTSDDAIELLSDQAEVNEMSDRLISACVFCSISPKLPRLEELLKTWFNKRNEFNRTMNFFEARVTSMTLVKFRLELERDITEEDDIWDDVPEWKTLPVVQRITLDVIARVEEEGRLKAISVKKVRKSLEIADATSWSSLTSNVSFADFTSLVLPPDPLSLDVKW
ncbi:hypothetical protein ZWY2020_017680 [Hordeum vulgare]|nr:hypothetical protein ZWY2020_017680 [Hordeum vulgare]